MQDLFKECFLKKSRIGQRKEQIKDVVSAAALFYLELLRCSGARLVSELVIP